MAAFHNLGRLLKDVARALHQAGLHDAIVFARGLDHLLSLFDRDGNGLFHPDVLARLACFHGHVGMPVIGRGNAHGIDGFVGKNLAEIMHGLRLLVELCGLSQGILQARLIHIAKRDYLQIGLLQHVLQIGGSHTAGADRRNRDAIIRASYVSGK